MQNDKNYIEPDKFALNELVSPIKGEKILVKMAANIFDDIAAKSADSIKDMTQGHPSLSDQFAIVTYWEDYMKKAMAASCFLGCGIENKKISKRPFVEKLNKKESLSDIELQSIKKDFEKVTSSYKQNKHKIALSMGNCSIDDMFDALNAVPNQESLERRYLASILVFNTSSKHKNSIYNDIQNIHTLKSDTQDKAYDIESSIMGQAFNMLTKDGFHIKGEELEIILEQIKDANHNMNVIKKMPTEDNSERKGEKEFSAPEIIKKVKENLFSMNSNVGLANSENRGLDTNPYFVGIMSDAITAINKQVSANVFKPMKEHFAKLETLRLDQDKIGDIFDQSRIYNNKYAYYKETTRDMALNVRPIKNKAALKKLLDSSRN